MRIDNETKETIKSIADRFKKVHSEYSKLEETLSEIKDKRMILAGELNDLRQEELSLINKIKQKNGIKLDQDTYMKILKNEI